VSGLWASSFALGAFIGPSIGGVMLDFVGFRWGSLVIIVIHVLSVSEIIYFNLFDFYIVYFFQFIAHLIFMNVESRRPKYTEILTGEFQPILSAEPVKPYSS